VTVVLLKLVPSTCSSAAPMVVARAVSDLMQRGKPAAVDQNAFRRPGP